MSDLEPHEYVGDMNDEQLAKYLKTFRPKPCPSCTYDNGMTWGCDECNLTGRARLWKIEGELLGGHYHATIRVGRPGSRARIGDLVMDIHDWKDLTQQLGDNPLWTIEEKES